MRKMSLFFLCSAMLLMAACAGSLPTVCDEISPGESVLCDIANKQGIRLEDVGLGLILVNSVAIKEGVYTRDQARGVVEKLLSCLDGSVTYALFRDRIQEYTAGYPGLLEVTQAYLYQFSLSKQISQTDREILTAWLNNRLKEL